METAVTTNEKPGSSAEKEQGPSSLRVSVELLDSLMTLAGELVLGRNQLLQALTRKDFKALEATCHRIDMVTSELQAQVMKTRMQPIGTVFDKLREQVRDLAGGLEKKVDLSIEGGQVELDRSIMESIGAPLTLLVKNAVFNGIETPEARTALGKPAEGKLKLAAFQEAGQVGIEIRDDGMGLDTDEITAAAVEAGLVAAPQAEEMARSEKLALLFQPGYAPLETSPPGSAGSPGMDEAKSEFEKLGGVLQLDSEKGKGTTVNIKLPLTLAIIPSQVVTVAGQRYAVPQVNLSELVRIPAEQVKSRIERVGSAEVIRLRGNLLPLVDLARELGIERTYEDPATGERLPEKRENIADRRSLDHDRPRKAFNNTDHREHNGRRISTSSALHIAIVSAGDLKYGIVVEAMNDSEEIVVKPLGRDLKDCKGYAGATIMGDGKVALILDVVGIAQMAGLSSAGAADRLNRISEGDHDEKTGAEDEDFFSFLLFYNSPEEKFAVPLDMVERIEKIKASDVEQVAGDKVLQYRNTSIPLIALSEVLNVSPIPDTEHLQVIHFKIAEREIGLLASPPVDAVDVQVRIDDTTLKQDGLLGSAIIGDQTTLIVDVTEVVKKTRPDWFVPE